MRRSNKVIHLSTYIAPSKETQELKLEYSPSDTMTKIPEAKDKGKMPSVDFYCPKHLMAYNRLMCVVLRPNIVRRQMRTGLCVLKHMSNLDVALRLRPLTFSSI